jgi:putative thioredoxin
MISLIQPNGSSLSQQTTPWIKEVNAASFMKEVAEASLQQPVLVDFWAPGCAPCRQLTPILEKLANAAKGQWLLAKINVDQNPQIAAQLRIKNLPTVYLFKAGQPVDGFMGLLSEAQIRQFLETHLSPTPTTTENDLKHFETAESLWQQDAAEQALALLLPFVQQQPTHAKAAALVMRCFYALGQADKAQHFFDHLPLDLKDNPELLTLQTLFQLITNGQGKETLPQLEQKKIKAPQDLSIVYDLSLRQFAEGQFAKSMETLIHLIQLNKEWPEARSTLIQMFTAIGSDHPFVHQCRRQLASVLFI